VDPGQGLRHVLPARAVDGDRDNPSDLELTTTVNGEIRQQARTSELLGTCPG
jgi:2-keto-4-pentenoate hydratase/2-oxohepta-3-ene-1,7-dioic acid hydratase (catechol pathway)